MNKAIINAKIVVCFVLSAYFLCEYSRRKKAYERKRKVADAKRVAKWDYIETCFVD